MAISAVDVVGPAFERTKQQLFRPFRLSQWLRLAITGLLAGEMGSAGGCNFQLPFKPPTTSTGQGLPSIPELSAITPVLLLGVGLLLIAILVLAVVFMVISSRMRFVLFDSIVARECRIRHFWSKRAEPGFRYFIWVGFFSIASFLAFILAVGIPVGIALGLGFLTTPRDRIVPLVLLGFAALVLVLAALIATAVISVLTKDFVVPQMACDGISALEGWRRLLAIMKQDKVAYAAYIGMKLVLTIAVGVLLGIISIVLVLIVLLPVGGAGVLAALWARSVGLGWNPVTIATAIVAGGIALAAVMLVVSLVSVPSVVFFSNYAMLYFADRYPPLHAALFPAANGGPELIRGQ